MFFRIVGLSDDREAIGAEGIPLTPGRSIAVDNVLHVYGTPFFIQAARPLTSEKRSAGFDRLMIAQDTGSAIVGPARADIYFGAGDQAGQSAGRVHNPGNFAMLVPRELDPVATGALMPLPREKPVSAALVGVKAPAEKTRTPCLAGAPCANPGRAAAPATDWRRKSAEHTLQTRPLFSVALRRRVSNRYLPSWLGLSAR
jgi:membrane-bound lytic murein transglycosylase A